jgi:hypothetical protein
MYKPLRHSKTFELFKPILSDNILLNNNFYDNYNKYVIEVAKEHNFNISELKASFLDNAFTIRDDMYNYDFELKSLATMLDLFFYPIVKKWTLKNKTYSSYNININFFNGIKNFMLEDDQQELFFDVFDFYFINKKLDSFILASNYGLKYLYNKNYELVAIEFADKEIFNMQ